MQHLNGSVSEALGPQPKEALLFAASNKSANQVIREQVQNESKIASLSRNGLPRRLKDNYIHAKILILEQLSLIDISPSLRNALDSLI